MINFSRLLSLLVGFVYFYAWLSWAIFLEQLIFEHSEETNSAFSRKILKNFKKEVKNFVQVCPKEMIEKLENPISLRGSIKQVI